MSQSRYQTPRTPNVRLHSEWYGGLSHSALLDSGRIDLVSPLPFTPSPPPLTSPPLLFPPQDHVALFQLALDDEDRGRIDEVLATGKRPRGDCYAWERGEGVF